MAISPTRAFVLGACSVFVIAGVFVAGIGIGANSYRLGDVTSGSPVAPVARDATCPSPPGFTATRAANDRVEDCETAQVVQQALLDAGATAANVQIVREPNSDLLGPESTTKVIAQVFLPDSVRNEWNAGQAAKVISLQVGTTIRDVTIVDEELRSLFDGSSIDPKVASKPAAPATAPPPRSTRVR